MLNNLIPQEFDLIPKSATAMCKFCRYTVKKLEYKDVWGNVLTICVIQSKTDQLVTSLFILVM